MHGIWTALAWIWWLLLSHWYSVLVLGLLGLMGLVAQRVFHSFSESMHDFVDNTTEATKLYGLVALIRSMAPTHVAPATSYILRSWVSLQTAAPVPLLDSVVDDGISWRLVPLTGGGTAFDSWLLFTNGQPN